MEPAANPPAPLRERPEPEPAERIELEVLSASVRLEFLVNNMALRLAKLDPRSQLLIRLGDPWAQPSDDDPPLPVFRPHNGHLRTQLDLLAERVQNEGERLNLYAAPPWARGNLWGKRLSIDTNTHAGDLRTPYIRRIRAESSEPRSSTLFIFTDGSRRNPGEDWTEPRAGFGVVVFYQGAEIAQQARALGTTANIYDAEMAALAAGVTMAQTALASIPSIRRIVFLTDSISSISTIYSARPHAAQRHSLHFKQTADNLLSLHRDLHIEIRWCPGHAGIPGNERADALARTGAALPLHSNQREPHTLTQQRMGNKEAAIAAWQQRWHASTRRSQAYLGLANPPNGKMAPAIEAMRKRKAPRSVFCTFIRLLTGHAFTGSYTARFFPAPGRPTSCMCGSPSNPPPLQTPEHVICECPLFETARTIHLRPIDRDYSLAKLFGTAEGGAAMLAFIQATHCCMVPRPERPDPP